MRSLVAELVAKYQIPLYHMIMVPVKYNLEVIDNKTFERYMMKGLNVQGEDQVGPRPSRGRQAGQAGRLDKPGLGWGNAGAWLRQIKPRSVLADRVSATRPPLEAGGPVLDYVVIIVRETFAEHSKICLKAHHALC